MSVYSKIAATLNKYPLLRGMMSYGLIWPISSLIQQTFEGKELDNYDWCRCARFGLYGSCYVAPTLYCWLSIANIMWPGNTIRAGLVKTFVETITYTPFAMCSFYFGMSLLEMKPFNEAVAEVKAKLWPTYKSTCDRCDALTHSKDSRLFSLRVSRGWRVERAGTVRLRHRGIACITINKYTISTCRKVGASVWPAVAMINFCFISPKNRVPFISVCSLLWTCFLAYMKHLDKDEMSKSRQSSIPLMKINI